MCGIVGAISKTPVNQLLYDALLLVQHRGQDAAGIVTSDGQRLHMHKGPGLVRDVFRTRDMRSLPGTSHRALPLPDRGLGVLQRGGAALLRQLPVRDRPRPQRQPHQRRAAQAGDVPAPICGTSTPNSDSEVLLNVLAHELGAGGEGAAARPGDYLFRCVERAPPMPRRLRGGRDDRRGGCPRLPPIRLASARSSSGATTPTPARNGSSPPRAS